MRPTFARGAANTGQREAALTTQLGCEQSAVTIPILTIMGRRLMRTTTYLDLSMSEDGHSSSLLPP